MDNKSIANILYETADLMEIRGDDSFRIRSYRRAAEAIEALSQQISEFIGDSKAVLAIPGIGKGMYANLQQLIREQKLSAHQELLTKYKPGILELLKIRGLGPKTIALLWEAFQVSDLSGLEKLAREGKLRNLPRISANKEQTILKAIEDFRRISGRFLIDKASQIAEKLLEYLHHNPKTGKVGVAGSLRRGKDTIAALQVVIGLSSKHDQGGARDYILKFPGTTEVLDSIGESVRFRLRNGIHVIANLVPVSSFEAAIRFFTGSKEHNLHMEQRAKRLGYTLNKDGLSTLKDSKLLFNQTEKSIFAKLGLEYITPELREDKGEIEAAEKHVLPELVCESDIQGDVHMHTVETDGRCSILEMAEAARAKGYKYLAITDHSKALAFANGLDDKRAEEHVRKIRQLNQEIENIRIFAGIEVDILSEGELDLSDLVLEQMDLVIASVHSNFQQDEAKMTDRLLRALENKNLSIVGHPTGRKLLRRDSYRFDLEKVFVAAANKKVALEHNSYPDRLDLSDTNLRLAREKGVKFVINTDAHQTSHLMNMRYGILQARRAWLTKDDLLNTRSVDDFARAMKHEW